MLLASLSEVRDFLGFDDMTNINDAIRNALNSATAQLESLLDTEFARATRTDTFWVPRPGFVDGGHASTELRLRRGFLTADPTCTYATVIGGDATTLTGLDNDLEKGILRDLSTRFSRVYVSVSYTYGFEEGTGEDAGSYVLEQVPSWLQEAAKLRALQLLTGNPTLTEAKVSLDAKTLDAQFATIVDRRQRYAPAALLPM